MIEGAIPDLNLLNKERKNLISIIKENGHQVIEIDFPKKLDGKHCKHDFVFIRDPFISDQNGTAIILRAGEQSRRIENFIVKSLLEKLGMKIKEIPYTHPPDHEGMSKTATNIVRFFKLGMDYVIRIIISKFRKN